MFGRCLSNLRLEHWRTVKSVLQCLQRTKKYMLTYRSSDKLESLGIWLWFLWIFITRLRVVDSIQSTLKLFCDNNSTVKFSKNNKNSKKSKFVALKILIIRKEFRVKNCQLHKLVQNLWLRIRFQRHYNPSGFLSMWLIWVLFLVQRMFSLCGSL